MVDHDKFRALVKQLYATVNELEAMFEVDPLNAYAAMISRISKASFWLWIMPFLN